jgi:hypothetical protein
MSDFISRLLERYANETNEEYRKLYADVADEIERLNILIERSRTRTLSEIIQYLESEGHGIPAEKVRAAFLSQEGHDV